MTEQLQKYDKVCKDCKFYTHSWADLCHFKSKHLTGYSEITNKPIFYGEMQCHEALSSFCRDHEFFIKRLTIVELFRLFYERCGAILRGL